MAHVLRKEPLALALVLCACGGETAPPAPPAPPATVRAELLQRMHGMLQGKLDRTDLELSCAADGTTLSILRMPEHLRVRDEPGGRMRLRARDETWWRDPGQPFRRMTPPEEQELRALDALVAAVLMQPLAQASGITRGDEGALRFDAGGEAWELRLAADGLPAELRGPRGATRFVEWQDNGLTVLPRRVEQDGRSWDVQIRSYDLVVDPKAFEPR